MDTSQPPPAPTAASASHSVTSMHAQLQRAPASTIADPVGIFIQPACLQHKYIRHANSSHIFERPERLRAVLLGVAAAAARLEQAEQRARDALEGLKGSGSVGGHGGSAQRASTGTSAGTDDGQKAENGMTDGSTERTAISKAEDDLSNLLSSLNLAKPPHPSSSSTPPTSSSPTPPPQHLHLVPPPLPTPTGQVLLHHPALQLAHSAPSEETIPYLPRHADGSASARRFGPALPSSEYMRELLKWATEAPERIKATGCEIPPDRGLNQGDLYLSPGSVLAIEGAIQTVCQAVDHVVSAASTRRRPSITSPTPHPLDSPAAVKEELDTGSGGFTKAFCAIRPPGHHCGQDEPSGFCYVNNVVVAAMHAYLEHDIDRAIIIDFDLHHGNGTQALIMPLNAATYADELAMKAGKPHSGMKGKDGKLRRGWKGFYGSVHDIYSYPCEDGDLDLVKDASLSLAAHGQYVENVHLQPYSSSTDFYTRIYPLYSTLLQRAEHFLSTSSSSSPGSGTHDPDRTILFISAGFDACEHEYSAMQRHDRRVPASFFERYTADVAAFADKWCGGKVVSVLEGGYSDRALMSGAMGHVVGMASAARAGCDGDGDGDVGMSASGSGGRGEMSVGVVAEGQRSAEAARTRSKMTIGEESWYAEEELSLLERATRKKRTGKLHPFPSDLAHLPHLARTHALLEHFGSIGTVDTAANPASGLGAGSMTPSHSAPSGIGNPSAQSTPVATGRMTLRTRKAAVEMDRDVEALVTPPRAAGAGAGTGAGASSRGRGRGRGGATGVGRTQDGRATTANTPVAKQAVSSVQDVALGGTPVIKVSKAHEAGTRTPTAGGAAASSSTASTGTTRVLRSSPSPSKPKAAPFDVKPNDEVKVESDGLEQRYREQTPGTPSAGSAGSASELDDGLLGAMGGMAIRGSPSPVKPAWASQEPPSSLAGSAPFVGRGKDPVRDVRVAVPVEDGASYTAYPQHFVTASTGPLVGTMSTSSNTRHPPTTTSDSMSATHASHTTPVPPQAGHIEPMQTPDNYPVQPALKDVTQREKIFLKFTRPTPTAGAGASAAAGSGETPKHFVSTTQTAPSFSPE